MITKEEFIKLITEQQNWDQRISDIGEVLGTFMLDIDWVEYTAKLFTSTLNLLFTEEAADTIMWWMYEVTDHSIPSMWDKDHNVIPMETIDDLWNFVKDMQHGSKN